MRTRERKRATSVAKRPDVFEMRNVTDGEGLFFCGVLGMTDGDLIAVGF